MADRKRKSKTGAPRTEVFAMRLDPKMKYLAEIAARKQRRSLANFIEWSIEESLRNVSLNDRGTTAADAAEELWRLDESDRLIQLALNFRDLMTYDEQLIWRVIQEYSTYNRDTERPARFVIQGAVQHEMVRTCWEQIKAYVSDASKKNLLDEAMCNYDCIVF